MGLGVRVRERERSKTSFPLSFFFLTLGPQLLLLALERPLVEAERPLERPLPLQRRPRRPRLGPLPHHQGLAGLLHARLPPVLAARVAAAAAPEGGGREALAHRDGGVAEVPAHLQDRLATAVEVLRFFISECGV